jgi:3-oxoacyl-[acyl-carrier protein] reductase
VSYGLTIGGKGAALVLGGSGGAGGHIALALARAGTDVAVTFNSYEDKARRVAAAIAGAGRKASTWKMDVTDPADVAAVVGAAAQAHGGIHTLVHAIGTIFTWDSIGDIAPAELRDVFAIEALGFHAALHAALPHLRSSGGSIVACTTWANTRIMPGDGLSTAPKAAIESMVRQVAREEAHHGIRANIVAVGSVDIGMGSAASDRSMAKGITDAQWAVMLRQIPLGERLGRGEELAAAAVFLASDQASYITGQKIAVDGGLGL